MPAKFGNTTKYFDARPGGALPPPKAKDDEAARTEADTAKTNTESAARPEPAGIMGSSVFIFSPELALAMMEEAREKLAARKAAEVKTQERKEELPPVQTSMPQYCENRQQLPAEKQNLPAGAPRAAEELPGVPKNSAKPAAFSAPMAENPVSAEAHAEGEEIAGMPVLTWITKYFGSGSGSAVLVSSGLLTSGIEVLTSGSGVSGSGLLGSGFSGSGFPGSGLIGSGFLSSGLLPGSGILGSGGMLTNEGISTGAETAAAQLGELADVAEYAATAAFMAMNCGAWYGLDILFNEIREPEYGVAAERTASESVGKTALADAGLRSQRAV